MDLLIPGKKTVKNNSFSWATTDRVRPLVEKAQRDYILRLPAIFHCIHLTTNQTRSTNTKDVLEKDSWPQPKKISEIQFLSISSIFTANFMFLLHQITLSHWSSPNHIVSHFSIYSHTNFSVLFCPLSACLLKESPLLGSPITNPSSQMLNALPLCSQGNLCCFQSRHDSHCLIVTCLLVSTILLDSGRKGLGPINGDGKSGSGTKCGEH